MLGKFRTIAIFSKAGQLEWRYGQEPVVDRVQMIDGEYSVQPASSPDLVALAERMANAAESILRQSPAGQTDLYYNLEQKALTGGCWWTSYDGMPLRSDFKAETLAKIQAGI